MKNLFKKSTPTTPETVVKNIAIKHAITTGINAATVIATPVAIKVVTDHIEDDYAKKAMYVTGGLLWAYQIANTIRYICTTRASFQVYKFINESDVNAIAAEGEDLLTELSGEMEEIYDGQEES